MIPQNLTSKIWLFNRDKWHESCCHGTLWSATHSCAELRECPKAVLVIHGFHVTSRVSASCQNHIVTNRSDFPLEQRENQVGLKGNPFHFKGLTIYRMFPAIIGSHQTCVDDGPQIFHVDASPERYLHSATSQRISWLRLTSCKGFGPRLP